MDFHVFDIIQQLGAPDGVGQIELLQQTGDGQRGRSAETAVLDIDRNGDAGES